LILAAAAVPTRYFHPAIISDSKIYSLLAEPGVSGKQPTITRRHSAAQTAPT
jgi:hypothetical protein